MANEDVQVSEQVTTEVAAEVTNPRLQAKLESRIEEGSTPAEALHSEMASLDRAIQGLEEPPTTGEPDPRVLIPGITSSLSTLGTMLDGAGVTKVSFSIAPSIAESPLEGWQAKARVDVYGSIQTKVDEEDPERGTELEADHLGVIEISGEMGSRVGDAVASLQDAVRKRLNSEIANRISEVQSLEQALQELKHEGELPKMWSVREPESETSET